MRAFSLIELSLGIALMSVLLLFGNQLYLAQTKKTKAEEARMTASSMIRQFLDLRRKSIQGAADMNLASFSDPRYMNNDDYSRCSGLSNTCGELYQSVTFALRAKPDDFPLSVFNADKAALETIPEIVEVECSATNSNSLKPIDLAAMAGPGSVFEHCAPTDCAATGGRLDTKTLPRLKITRRVPIKILDASGNVIGVKKDGGITERQEVVTYFPPTVPDFSSNIQQGVPVAAAACLQINPGSDINTFRDISLSIFTLQKTEGDRFEMSHQVANFPRPAIQSPDSIKILRVIPTTK